MSGIADGVLENFIKRDVGGTSPYNAVKKAAPMYESRYRKLAERKEKVLA